MTDERGFDRIAAQWLDDGSDTTPPEVIAAVLLAVRSTPQERDFRILRRIPSMTFYLRVAAVVAVFAVAGMAAFYALGTGPNVGSGPSLDSTTQPTSMPPQTATPTASPIDTTSWTTYESDRYGFSIDHPADWTVAPASHDWTMAEDADNWLSSGQEVFRSPNIRVSAWSVPVDRGTTPETPAGVEAWVQDYCAQADSGPCTVINERAVPLCVERRDCHPGLLVPFETDVQAFFTGGGYGERMVVVAVWWEESAPAVAAYGGSQALLEAFLSTMGVCEAGDSFESRDPGC